MSETLKSPLSEVDKNSLSELFQRDPLSLTKADVTAICIELRKARAQWVADEGKTKTKTAKVQLSQAEMDDILNSL